MEISFYQVAEGNLVSAIVRILEKVYLSGQRCVFFSPLEERVKAIDRTLWTFSTNAFIPHGDKSLGFCDKQPIYFTCEFENPNGATVLVLVDTLDYESYPGFERTIVFFEGKEAETNALRIFNEKNNTDSFRCNYWKQSSKGWEKLI